MYVCIHVYIYIYIHIYIDLSIYLSIYLSIDRSIYLSIYLSIGVNDIIGFDFMDPPPVQTLVNAMETLYALGMLTYADAC